MTTRLTELTDEQRAAIPTHVEKWIARGLSTEPTDWALVESGIRRCYGYADQPWHGNVIRVSSPIVGALAAPIAAGIPIGKSRHSAVGSAVRSAVDSAVDSAVGSAVGSAVRSAVGSAVRSAVGSAVDSAVGSAVRSAVDSAVDSAVGSAVGPAVGSAVRSAVRSAVGSAVDSAVRSAVRSAVGSAVWYQLLGGSFWAYWPAYTSFYRDVCHLPLPGDMWDRDRAYADAQSAGWWWPNQRFTIVTDRPEQIRIETVDAARRLHNPNGPSIAWRDGWALHHWHGTQVPADLVEGPGWDVDRIMRERNTEIRRCAVERLGWDRFIPAAGLTPVATAPDPGNPGYLIELYDVPDGLYAEPVRLTLVTNATPERDGSRRRYGETVPASISDPIAAVAWGFGLNPSQYRAVARAT